MEEGKQIRRYLILVILVLVSGLFIFLGIYRGEVSILFNKAIRICMECIGLG